MAEARPDRAPSVDIVICDKCATKNRLPASARGVPTCGKCHNPLPWVTEAGDDDYEQVVGASTLPVLLDLWAEWCGPCRTVSPALEQLAHEMAGRLKLVKVNVDKSPTLAERFDARSIPMLLVIRRGKVVSRQVGAVPVHALRAWLDSALDANRG
ncbi:MAG TPA: thioredoxin [Acidimicrobiales bacterium]|nr:thioredoxin [Acidimicrobiales bacterium]